MWQLKDPQPVKLIVGILAANHQCLHSAVDMLSDKFGRIDLSSEEWHFNQTDYYNDEIGTRILRKFVSFEKLIDPGKLAKIKILANKYEQKLAKSLSLPLPRPINLDPGIIEPSKLILASTKNFSHRIYIGKKMYAEVTLVYDKGKWRHFEYTFPDYKQECYWEFLSKVRVRLVEQLKRYNARKK
ncbi:MAG: DUF4416 family protein [Sedimentisphaerales bacterium]|nr:DUF4416 family protein [Sedimentisphaerales bacterium]